MNRRALWTLCAAEAIATLLLSVAGIERLLPLWLRVACILLAAAGAVITATTASGLVTPRRTSPKRSVAEWQKSFDDEAVQENIRSYDDVFVLVSADVAKRRIPGDEARLVLDLENRLRALLGDLKGTGPASDLHSEDAPVATGQRERPRKDVN